MGNQQESTNAINSFAAFLAMWGQLGEGADNIKQELTDLSRLLKPLCEVEENNDIADKDCTRVQKAFSDQSHQWNYVCGCAKVAYTNVESGQKC
jgi:hypothetical protein